MAGIQSRRLVFAHNCAFASSPPNFGSEERIRLDSAARSLLH